MSIMQFLRGVIGSEEPTICVEGTIVEGPAKVESEGATTRSVVFRLDTCPQIQFQQAFSALAPERRQGERVRVHYRMNGPIADVQWLERI